VISRFRRSIAATFALVPACLAVALAAQAPSTPVRQTPVPAQTGRGGGPAAPAFVSPEVGADRRITFRLYAPNADAVRLSAGISQAWGRARS
jgi:hypothetical protein